MFDAARWQPLPVRTAAATDPERALQALLDWARAGGATFDAIDFRTTPAGYRRGYAARAIADGEPIVSVPRALLITNVDALAAEATAPLAGFHGFLASGYSALAAWLARAVDDDASPCVRALPVDLSHLPEYRAGADLAALTGTRALVEIVTKATGVREDLELIAGEVPDLADLPLADFAWARAVAASRCFRMDDDDGSARALVPLVDLFDHAEQYGAIWTYQRDRRAFEIRAARAHVAGEELHVSYGPHDNAWWVASHGVAFADNPDDTILVEVGGRTVELGGARDRRFERALALAGSPAALAEAARAVDAALAAAPPPPAGDPAWAALCRTVIAGERAVAAAIVALAER